MSKRLINSYQYNTELLLEESLLELSEIKDVQRKLKERENNFNTFFNSMEDIICVLNKNGKILFTNESGKEKLGYTEEELGKMNILELHPKEYQEEAARVIEKIFQGKAKVCSLPIITKSGKYIQVETRVVAGKWSEQDVLFGISKDMSDIHMANERFYKAFENNPSPMAISTIETGEYIEVNRAFCQVLEFDEKEVIGQKSNNLDLFVDYTVREKVLSILNSDGFVKDLEVQLKTKKGKRVTGLLSVDYIMITGRKYLLTVLFDITERKNIEEELRLAKLAAESANMAKSRFLANISHEIRTPMNGLRGFLDLLSTTSLSGKQQDYLNEALNASEILLYVINDLLDYSKIEAGILNLEEISFDVRAVLKKVVSLNKVTADEKKLKLLLKIEENVPWEIIGDPIRVRQVINNLLNNAIKYTEKGLININVALEEENDNHVVLDFVVQDTGIGIPKECLSQLFKPFIQVDDSITRKYSGTGLGLAICSELVEKMGGKIEVASALDKGSRFHFTIKAKKGNQQIDQVPLPKVAYTAKEVKIEEIFKVLLVEDNQMNRKVVLKILEQDPSIVCDIAENGLQALEACEKFQYDLIFMDCQMPEMDGYQVTELLRVKEGGLQKQTTIVAMTAYAMKGDREKCLAAGMDDYLSKPVSIQSIFNMVNKYRRTKSDKKILIESSYGFDDFNLVCQRLSDECGFSIFEAQKIINDFTYILPDKYRELEDFLEYGEITNALHLLHEIKGAAGNTRMSVLYCLLSEFEAQLRDSKYINNLMYLKKFKNYIQRTFKACCHGGKSNV